MKRRASQPVKQPHDGVIVELAFIGENIPAVYFPDRTSREDQEFVTRWLHAVRPDSRELAKEISRQIVQSHTTVTNARRPRP